MAEIERLEQRLKKISSKIERVLAEDRITIENLDRATHCSRVLKLMMEPSPEPSIVNQNVVSNSPSDTTSSSSARSSDTNHLNESRGSTESALESHRLFPVVPQKLGEPPQPVTKPCSQKEFIRNINSHQAERLRTILGGIKERMAQWNQEPDL